MLTMSEIEGAIERLEQSLDGIEKGEIEVSELIEVRATFDVLRAEYRHQPETLQKWVGELHGLRKRYDDLLATKRGRIVDRYQSLSEELERLTTERESLRELLIERANPKARTTYEGGEATVVVKSVRARKLPKAGSEERAELEEVIRDSGHWEQVSIIQVAKLDRLIKQKAFSTETTKAIETLCPAERRFQVSCRRRSRTEELNSEPF